MLYTNQEFHDQYLLLRVIQNSHFRNVAPDLVNGLNIVPLYVTKSQVLTPPNLHGRIEVPSDTLEIRQASKSMLVMNPVFVKKIPA
jgi:hypothetical protein